jgi:hypothetical protein
VADQPKDEGKGEPKNVVDLDAERAKREADAAAAAQPKPKPKRSDHYGAVARAIDGQASRLPEFPQRYHVVQPEPGKRLVLMEGQDGVVRYVDPAAVSDSILRYSARELAGRDAYKWEVKHAVACMHYWRSMAEPIDEPPAVRWSGEDGLTFSRLPWTYQPDFDGHRTPLFNELFRRVSNAPALVEWIGSLFDPDADRQQYVWLYGPGGNGKGALSRFLERVFGRAYRSVQPPDRMDRNWTAGLVGARLVVLPDCNAYGFPASGLFKALTGNDSVTINEKYERAYSARLTSKFMFLSNERPQLSSEAADMRRAIYCEVQAISNAVDPAYERRLWEEGGWFLSNCIHNYRTTYPQGGPVRVDAEELTAWVEVVEEDFDDLVDQDFVLGAGLRCFQTRWVAWCKGKFRDTHEKRRFMAYVERKHGLRLHDKARRTVALKGGGTAKAYFGFRLREPDEPRPLEIE